MKKTAQKIAVIGLGTFGSSMARELREQGADVVAIDVKQELVDSISNDVNNAICFDCTNEKSLEGYLGGSLDLAIVAIGENFGNTVIITKILKDLNITVYSRASSDREEKILEAVGADKIYRPEHEQGISEARAITYSGVKDFVRLKSGMDLIVTEPRKAMLGRTIRDLDVRKSYEVNIAFLGELMEDSSYEYRIPSPDDVLNEGDLLWLVGSIEHIRDYTEK
ncbi:MAG: TrkA family potassium uptake protein [Candidatus Sabulitectum sp.]|nr:TrkA family potassium uptake protein [Candidatus Sabulitectum sp.]